MSQSQTERRARLRSAGDWHNGRVPIAQADQKHPLSSLRTITHTSLQVGWTLIGIFAGLGFLSIVSGAGLIWAVRGKEDEKEAMPEIVIPDTIPEDIPKEVLVK